MRRRGRRRPFGAPLPGWKDLIRKLARPLELASRWPGLGEYLVVTAFTESGGNPKVVNKLEPNNPNAARGWFGMRPATALVGPVKGANPDILLDPAWSVILAADLAWRLRKYREDIPAADLTWAAIRRGWALPRLVDDVEWEQPRSQDVRERMLKAQAATGIDIADWPAFAADTRWVGIERAADLLRALAAGDDSIPAEAPLEDEDLEDEDLEDEDEGDGFADAHLEDIADEYEDLEPAPSPWSTPPPPPPPSPSRGGALPWLGLLGLLFFGPELARALSSRAR